MPIDPTDLANSIGALGSLDPERGLARTLQQVTDGAKRLLRADAAGLMLIDQEGQLRWASASDWDKFAQVLLGKEICAALSVPVELDGGVTAPWTSMSARRGTGIPARSRSCRPMPGWWPACSRRR